MFRLTLLALFCASFISCHKKIGSFQQSKREIFYSEPSIVDKRVTSEIPLIFENPSEEFEAVVASSITDLHIETPLTDINISFQKDELVKDNSKSEIIASNIESDFSEKPKKQIKNKPIKRNPVFNDSLKIGIVFLLIAAIFAFLPALLQLAVLFALVSMVFLFIGLKKLFNRRAKIKKKKIRKENNQIRKEKIKGIFNK